MKSFARKSYMLWIFLLAVAVLIGLRSGASVLAEADGTPTTSAFTFQGQLKNAEGAPINNTCAFTFSIWDAADGGTQQGADQSAEGIVVANGFFTVELNFGNQFTGEARWIEIRTRCNGDAADTKMDRRILLTSSPYAIGLMPGAMMRSSTPGYTLFVENSAPESAAVHGKATADHGTGVFGESTSWAGVWGESTGASGVVGISSSQFSGGVYGENKDKGHGVIGKATSGAGVYGESAVSAGVWGRSATASGVVGVSVGEFNAGVYGENTGKGYGVLGKSANGSGVVGQSTAWIGVYGETARTADGIWAAVKRVQGKAGVIGIGVKGVANEPRGRRVAIACRYRGGRVRMRWCVGLDKPRRHAGVAGVNRKRRQRCLWPQRGRRICRLRRRQNGRQGSAYLRRRRSG